MDEMTLELHSPITDEEWDMIADYDFENTNEITFHTKHGKDVTFWKKPNWIPCSERLPRKEKKKYWVCTDTEYQCECRWTNNRFGLCEGEWGWSIFDTPQYSKPIAWMPLPEPFEEVEE